MESIEGNKPYKTKVIIMSNNSNQPEGKPMTKDEIISERWDKRVFLSDAAREQVLIMMDEYATQLKEEIERLKGLVETEVRRSHWWFLVEKGEPEVEKLTDEHWQQFKTENNL